MSLTLLWLSTPRKEKSAPFTQYTSLERITGDETKTVNERFRGRKTTKQGVGEGLYARQTTTMRLARTRTLAGGRFSRKRAKLTSLATINFSVFRRNESC